MSRSRIKTYILLALLLAILLSLVWWGHVRARQAFVTSYNAYHTQAKTQQDAAYLPGTTGNPLRQELNLVLSQALAKDTSDGNRLSLVEHGLTLIGDANHEVDAIAAAAPPVTDAISRMESAGGNPLYIYEHGHVTTIATLARAQMGIIEDIRGLSYRANFETQQIFNRIIADHGALTSAYAQELNDNLPQVEQEFDKRENLYTDLGKNVAAIDAQFSAVEKDL